MCPQKNQIEALTLVLQNSTKFGYRLFKDVIKIKRGPKDGVLIQHDWCPSKKRKYTHTHTPQGCTRREGRKRRGPSSTKGKGLG